MALDDMVLYWTDNILTSTVRLTILASDPKMCTLVRLLQFFCTTKHVKFRSWLTFSTDVAQPGCSNRILR